MQILQSVLDDVEIRYQAVHDAAPGSVERLVPDTGRICTDPSSESTAPSGDGSRLGSDDLVAIFVRDQVHFVDQSENACVGGVFVEGRDDGTVGLQVAIRVATSAVGEIGRLDVEDVDQDAYIPEDVGLLRCQITLCESILPDPTSAVKRTSGLTVGRKPSTVPDIEQEIAQKLDSFLVDVNGGA